MTDQTPDRSAPVEHCPQCNRPAPQLPFCECGFDLVGGAVERPTQGQCAYCGKGCRYTGQHIVGDWARKYYAVSGKQYHLISRPKGAGVDGELVSKHQKARPQRYGQEVWNICGDCNSGWLSTNVERPMIPRLKELAAGKWRSFGPQEARAFARWIATRVVSFDEYARNRTVPQDHRTALMEGHMPGGWRIYVGILKKGNETGRSFTRTVDLDIQAGEASFYACISSFCLERLIVLAVCVSDEGILQLARAIETFSPELVEGIPGLFSVEPLRPNQPAPGTDLAVEDVWSWIPRSQFDGEVPGLSD